MSGYDGPSALIAREAVADIGKLWDRRIAASVVRAVQISQLRTPKLSSHYQVLFFYSLLYSIFLMYYLHLVRFPLGLRSIDGEIANGV